MPEVFFISDTHLGHDNILKFTKNDGTRLRNFESLDHMHQTIIDNWCAKVGPNDKVYHLGDVAFTRRGLDIIGSLPGIKRLVRGNHDNYSTNTYKKYFNEIYGVRQLDGYWFTHIPIHPGSLGERAKANVHGHLHANTVDDSRYLNVSVERIDFTPISFDEVKDIIRARSD